MHAIPPSGGPTRPGPTTATVVAVDRAERFLVWAGLPVLGAVAGWLLVLAAAWVADTRFVPYRGLFRLLDRLDGPWPLVVALSAGVVGGLVLAAVEEHQRLEVEVSADAVLLTREGRTLRFARADVSGVFVDGKDLVLTDRVTAELAREHTDLPRTRLAAAFVAHGLPWLPDGDPKAADFRRWVAGTPDLPAGAAGLLGARAKALAKGRTADTRALRAELARLGVVVRDEGKRQSWRLVPPPQ